ncbi:hypothetical protein SAMN02745117_02734 [Lampropedia hyalina DSM 16112]|jgi:hypothetical protein|uniref:Uncharacterized protein n=1 Tax=Lampropedia hyalina DSM 16112 TaxID=1122156 RepID=A0A1M5F3J4_9BURK|nr:hypothetical protein [Lampropedia hyalina]SHF86129.1 hypothetical protein SAMN02745117_02734 [Lampropedia hyalina DSM 16112]
MDNDNEVLQFAKTFWSEQVQAETENNILFKDVRASYPTEADMELMGDALEQAARDPDTNDFDVLVMLAAGLMRENERRPDWLASFAADVLEGKRKRPTKRGADKYKNWQRDYSLWRAVEEVACKFELPKYTNNELSNKTTAARIVAEAARLNVDVVITAYKTFSKGGK